MRVLMIATMTGLLAACSTPPAPEDAPKAGKPGDAEPSKVPEAKPAEVDTKADASKPPPLSEEDKRLIAMDPADLTPELRRKRAYARRREAMQDPNSPLARTLGDLQKAYEDGEIDPNGSGMPTFTVDGKPPTSGKGPAGTRKGPAGAETPAE